MCLLIIGLVVTGCGNAAGSGSLNNLPVIYSVTRPEEAPTDPATGDMTITISGRNFGYQEDGIVYYCGYTSDNNSSSGPHKVKLNLVDNGGSWNDSEIRVKLYKATRDQYPYGSFSVNAKGVETGESQKCQYGIGSMGSVIATVSRPTVYSYETDGAMTLECSGGFGTTVQDLLLTSTNGYNKTITRAEIYNWTDRIITFVLPMSDMANSITNNTTFYIRANNSYSISNIATFEYRVPSIYNVSPNSGSIGKIITIAGQNLGNAQGLLNVYIDNDYANIVSWSDSYIQVRVPNTSTAGVKAVRLRRGDKDIGINLSYEVKAPVIWSASKLTDLSAGDSVTVLGNYFGSAEELQAIYSSSARIEITEKDGTNSAMLSINDASVNWTDSAITFTWPKFGSNILSDKTFNIRVVIGSEAFSSNTISVTD